MLAPVTTQCLNFLFARAGEIKIKSSRPCVSVIYYTRTTTTPHSMIFNHKDLGGSLSNIINLIYFDHVHLGLYYFILPRRHFSQWCAYICFNIYAMMGRPADIIYCTSLTLHLRTWRYILYA